MKIRLIALMSLAGVVALSGCTVGPDYKRPMLDVPLEYRQISKEVEDNAQWLTARWWTQYQDPAIDALVSSAIKNNRTLQQTMSNVEKAAAAVTVARADLFPQLNYQGDAMRQRQSINTAMGEALQGKPFSTKEVLASASWEIDLWGKIRRKTESATATLRSMEAAHKAALSSVITSVVTTYLSILTVDEQLEVAKETANSYYQTYSLFKVRATHGNVSDMEVAQAKSQWQSAKVEIPVLQQSRVELMNSLSILTGVDVGDMPKFKRLRALKVPAIGKGIPSKLLTERPDIVEAEENLKAAQAMAKKIEDWLVETKIKTGEGGRTFGSVSSKEICAAVKSQYNETIDKKKVHLEEPIRAQGTYEVKVKLHPQVTAVMRVHVSGE